MIVIQLFIANHGSSFVSRYLQISSHEQVSFYDQYILPIQFDLKFICLLLSVMLIAGAGNIINDYFDIKADRINKPDKMIVEKHISLKSALMWYWVFNFIALSLSIYLSAILQNWWIAGIALITIVFLWSYSALYKRKIFVGNVIVAFLIGVVPIYVLVYNFPIEGFNVSYTGSGLDFGPFFVYEIVIIVAVIAFVLNLMREIIKDMADIRGDLHLEAKTVPIALGIRRTKTILTILLVPLLLLMSYYAFNIHHYNNLFIKIHEKMGAFGFQLFEQIGYFTFCMLGSTISCIFSFILLLTSNTRKKYLLSSNLLKIAMLFGVISPLFL